MKLLLTLILSAFVANYAVAQQRINPDKASAYVGNIVEVLGHAYYVRSVNRDFAIMKIGYRLKDARLMVYMKFRSAAGLASLIKFEFVHFIGTVSVIDGKPVLTVDKLNNVNNYAPKNERVDSGLYYHKKGY
jgi:hypothetical protein